MKINTLDKTDGIADSLQDARAKKVYDNLSDLADELDGWAPCLIDWEENPSLFALNTTDLDVESAVQTLIGVAPMMDSSYHVFPFALEGHEVTVAVLDTRSDGITEETIREWRPELHQATLLELGVVPPPETTLAEAVERVRHYCEMLG